MGTGGREHAIDAGKKKDTGPKTTKKPHAARVAALRGVVDRREALAVPLVRVGAALISTSKHAAWARGLPSSALDFFEHRYKFEVALVIIRPSLTRSRSSIFRWTMHILTQVTTEGSALVRRRANLAQFFREPASGVASMASRWRRQIQHGVKTPGRVVGELGRRRARGCRASSPRPRAWTPCPRPARVVRLDGVPRTGASSQRPFDATRDGVKGTPHNERAGTSTAPSGPSEVLGRALEHRLRDIPLDVSPRRGNRPERNPNFASASIHTDTPSRLRNRSFAPALFLQRLDALLYLVLLL